MNSLRFEADELSGMSDLRGQFPVIPDDPTDDPLFAYGLGKARDHNRLPARVMEDAFVKAVSTGDVVITDEFTGLPLKLEKVSAAEPEDVEIELSPALEARLRTITNNIVVGLSKSLARAMPTPAPASAAPLRKAFKRVPLFDECTCAAEGRKCKACREKNVLKIEEKGNARTIFWEGGETFETV